MEWQASIFVLILNRFRIRLKYYPEAVRHEDKQGLLPVHSAICRTVSKDIIQLLLEYQWMPQTPLEGALSDPALKTDLKQLTKMVQIILSAYPDVVQQRDKNGCMPLHLACHTNAPIAVIRTLLEKNPDAVRETDNQGRTPLHLACTGLASREVIELLLVECPALVREKDSQGHLPLHTICRYGPSMEVVELIFQKYPEAVHETNMDGHSPLHLVSLFHSSKVNVVMFLVKMDPERLLR